MYRPFILLLFRTKTPFPVSPKGRTERFKIVLWTILAKVPVCRGDSFPLGGRHWEGGKIRSKNY